MNLQLPEYWEFHGSYQFIFVYAVHSTTTTNIYKYMKEATSYQVLRERLLYRKEARLGLGYWWFFIELLDSYRCFHL